MSLQGEQPPYLMSGKVLVTNGLWAKEFGAKPTSAVSVATEPTLRYNFDVELGANCRARNSVISTLATGKITLGGTDLQPEIQGSLDLLNGSVTAKSNEFRISQGRVAFLGGGTQIPNVNLLATTTMKQTSQDYRVQLHVRGPGDKLAVDLSSDPPLTQPEIVNLLAFGVIRPKNNESTDNAPYEALGAFLGSALSSSGLARSAGVQVRVETSQSIAQDRAIPKVTAVRRISDKVTATYGRSLELKPEQNIQVDYQLLKNVNLTGIWESRVSGGGGVGSEEEQSSSSAGVDLRFKFDLK